MSAPEKHQNYRTYAGPASSKNNGHHQKGQSATNTSHKRVQYSLHFVQLNCSNIQPATVGKNRTRVCPEHAKEFHDHLSTFVSYKSVPTTLTANSTYATHGNQKHTGHTRYLKLNAHSVVWTTQSYSNQTRLPRQWQNHRTHTTFLDH
jgi:hypothetical protein